MNIVSGSVAENDNEAASVRFRTTEGRVSRKVSAMKEKKKDRRVERTRELLSRALLSLIPEKGFDAVTVQDVIDRANVGRSTFYTHFVDKEDLLIQAMDPFSVHLRERQRKALSAGGHSDAGAFAFSRELFSHAEGHRDVFRAMVGKQSALVLQRHFQRMQVDLVREELRAMMPRTAASAAPPEARRRQAPVRRPARRRCSTARLPP